MKSFSKNIGIILLFFVMLLFPAAVFEGASNGLLLWFQIVLPTLFPFLLISNLLFATGGLHVIADTLGKSLSVLFHVSKSSSFAIVAGFLCGYPMGAKTSADLVKRGYISRDEGEYLLSFCNNISPVFIINFITAKTMDRQDMILPTVLISLLTPVIVSLFTRRIYHFEIQKGETKDFLQNWDFDEIDKSIMDSFETLIKVGGYIMLFSVFLVLLQKIAIHTTVYSCLLSTLEMTNGIVLLGKMQLPFGIKYSAILGLASFGGWCSAAQTKCVVQDTGFRTGFYIIEKLAAALTASLLSMIYIHLL